MGIYLNPGDRAYRMALRSEIYVDKTGLLAQLDRLLDTAQRFVCISRPRRFGKTMAADMVSAYYDRTVDGAELFAGRIITKALSFAACRNRYDVIHVNMQTFLSAASSMEELLRLLYEELAEDIQEVYPDVRAGTRRSLPSLLQHAFQVTQRPFVIVIDEWDCIIREYREDKDAQERYLDFLRDLLKDRTYVALAYMTGILPIKKYGTHSALNMFDEYSMTSPGPFAPFFGFTTAEVQALCRRYHMEFACVKAWYDGYAFPGVGEIYSPRSVVAAMLHGTLDTYWNQTETFQALRIYIDLDFGGLRAAVIRLIAGECIPIETGTFNNDMTTFHTADDVLTLLVHLGYLAYDRATSRVHVPNREVMMEFVNAISVGGWDEVVRAIKASNELLQAVWRQDEAAVAAGVEAAHFETSQLAYHDENALACTISLAFYAAREYYDCYRELPAGKGFADIVFVPRTQYAEKLALVIELKWNKDAATAIRQIREKQYVKALQSYHGKIILVGINYDRKTKEHTCQIEMVEPFCGKKTCTELK
ncbi:AAA family ATPase [uncultured Selenomonas sp.]|uniref:AAA family ATPase n=1 Tax=uncultured Selenomonas sp. TaxID=159275 RepID=UPI0025F0D8DE|nr:AAA family ATPase [uncultured Selenomonas sp.]